MFPPLTKFHCDFKIFVNGVNISFFHLYIFSPCDYDIRVIERGVVKMKTKEQIIDEAKESYESTFKNPEEKPFRDEEVDDVVVNKDKIMHEIEKGKEAEKSHESLNVLREHLEDEAEKSFEKVFHEEKAEGHVNRKTTDEMEKELEAEKERQTKLANDLKNKEMNK